MTIEETIKKEYGWESRHVRSGQVYDSVGGQISRQGIVEAFDLIGDPEAKRAYAWMYSEGNQDYTVMWLEKPPVNSGQFAVKVTVASKARSQRGTRFS